MRKTYIFSPVILFLALLVCTSSASAGAVYSCTDASGKSVYQQVPCSIDSLGSLTDTQTSDASGRQAAVLQAAAADYAARIKALETMMANDEKQNQALEQKGDPVQAPAEENPTTK